MIAVRFAVFQLILDIQEETSSMESATTTTKQVGIIIVTVVWFVSILCSALRVQAFEN